MVIQFSCDSCGKALRAPEGAEGRKCRCPKCGTVARVPTHGSLVSATDSNERNTRRSRPLNPAVLMVGGIVVAGGIIVSIIGYYGYSLSKDKTEGRENLIRSVNEQITSANSKAEACECDAALGILDTADEQVEDSSHADVYLYEDLKGKIAAARQAIPLRERECEQKLAQGWVVFDGRLMQPEEKWRIVAERRRKAEEQERHRREAEERRRAGEARRQREALRARAEGLKEDAYLMSQVFVERQLKVPSSARFPVFGSSDVIVAFDDSAGKFTVMAWVEAQNPFGVYLRSTYLCQLWPTGGDNWKSDLTSID